MILSQGDAMHCLRSMQEVTWSEPVVQSCAQFVGVTDETIHFWITGKQRPKGITLIRLMLFLTLLGYRVLEYSKLTERKKQLANIVGLQLLPKADLFVALKIDKRQRPEIPLVGFLMRGRSMSVERFAAVDALVERFSSSIDQEMIKVSATLPQVIVAPAQSVHPEEPERIIKREVIPPEIPPVLPVVPTVPSHFSETKDESFTPQDHGASRASSVAVFTLDRLHTSLKSIEKAPPDVQEAVAKRMSHGLILEVIELLIVLAERAK